MARTELYEILLKIAAEADPSAFNELKKFLDSLQEHKVAIEEINRDLAKVAQWKYPDVFAKYSQEVARLTQEEKRLAQAESEVTTAAREQSGILSSLLGILRDVAVVVGGILIRDIIVGGIRKVQEFAGALRDMAVDFVGGMKDINATMELYKAQMTGLLGDVKLAVDALAYARQVGLDMPLVDMPDIVNAIKMLTAFGQNYQKWLLVIGSVSAATGKNIATIVNAIGMIAAGNVRYGLYYLERAGIDLKGLSVEGRKASDVLDDLFELLSTRYGQVLPEMMRTWEGSMSTLGKLWYLFREELGKPAFEIASKRLADFVQGLADKKDDILAFASVLGEYPARALQSFLSFLDEITAGIDFQAQDFFKGAVNLIVSFTDGILTALDSYLLPAIVGIADLIASFLLGTSPPPRGPLSRVYEGAIAVMKTYLLALKEGVDFQTLNEIAGFIQAALIHAVSIGDLPEAQLYSTIIRARQQVAQAISQMRALGGASPAISGELADLLGPIYQDVQKYLDLLRQLQAATDAVTAAQERLAAAQAWVEEATKKVQEAQDRLRRFELETAEIPERFTRGRRRELEMAIQEAEEERRRRQEAVDIAQQQLRAAQEQVNAVKEQISLQRAYMSELEKIWRLQEEQAKAQKEGAGALGDWKKGLRDINTEIEEMKKKWRPIIEDILKPLERLEKHWQRLGDLVRGFLGIVPEEPIGIGWEPGQIEFSEFYRQGERFRTALETIRDNFYKIVEAAERLLTTLKDIGTWAWEHRELVGGGFLVIKGVEWATGVSFFEALAMALGIPTGAITTGAGGIPTFLVAIAIGSFTIIKKLHEIEDPALRLLLELLFPTVTVLPEIQKRAQEMGLAMRRGLLAGLGLGEEAGIGQIFEAFDKKAAEWSEKGGFIPFAIGNLIQGIIDHIKGQPRDVEEAAGEGLFEPIFKKASELWDKLVGHSIFPDMIKEIIGLFRGLPWKLYPYLISLYRVITTWIQAASISWQLQLSSMTRAVDGLVDALEDLINVLERLYRLLGLWGGAGTIGQTPSLGWTRHGGGPIFRTGQYQLQAGEYVLNPEQTALAGIGASALGPPIVINQENYWPEGVDRMKRRELEKIVKKGASEIIHELMRTSGRD